jgi:hypothetical protein
MFLDHFPGRFKFRIRHPVILRQFYPWFDPEFCLSTLTSNMYMHPRLFA